MCSLPEIPFQTILYSFGFVYILVKSMIRSFPNGEVMSVKRAYGLLGVAGTQHGELGRLLSRRVIRVQARNDSPVTSFMDLTVHQRTAKQTFKQLHSHERLYKQQQSNSRASLRKLIYQLGVAKSPHSTFPITQCGYHVLGNSCFTPLIQSSCPTSCSHKGSIRKLDSTFPILSYNQKKTASSPHFWLILICYHDKEKKLLDILKCFFILLKKKKNV